MKPVLRPEDALELELQGKATGACPEELVQLGSTLRAAAAQIEAPIGLRARRGSIIAAPTARVTIGRRLRFPRRRLQVLLLAAALTAMSALSVAGAVGSGWIGEAVDDFVRSVLGSPAVSGPLAPSPSPTPTRTPPPSPWQPPPGTGDAPADVAEDDPRTGVPGGSSVEPTDEPQTDRPSASEWPQASVAPEPSATPLATPSATPTTIPPATPSATPTTIPPATPLATPSAYDQPSSGIVNASADAPQGSPAAPER